MISKDRILINRHLNSYYIANHKNLFDADDFLYPLPIYEDFVRQTVDWGLECSCKIQGEKLYTTRFNLYSFHPSLYDYQLVFDFFRQVQGRADIKLDTRLPYQFIGSDLDFSKIRTIALGIDLRKEFNRSRLKFWVVPTNYSEKLEMAISLCEPNEEELKTLLLTKNALSVGFDIFLHGHTDIEVYLTLHAEQFQQVDVWQQLTQLLSPPALKLLEECWLLIIGFSKANPEKAIYYAPYNPNDFVANLGNDMANRVYASYRAHPLPMQHIIVALRESEILSGTIQNLNLYSSEQVYFKHPSGITKSRAALT